MIYTCPMHPEIRQETPGRCPKCGMNLVPVETAKTNVVTSDNKGLGALTWQSYLPLITIVFLILIVSAVISWRDYQADSFSIFQSISYFMIGFFIVFASFKLMDLEGFAHGYFTYDLLAKHLFAYGYLYPFIELGFGLAMLVGIQNPLLLWAEVIVMAFSGLGVAIKLAKHEKFQCACLGTFLKVPLTKITIIEDFGMAALALVLLFK
jgi:hypothetical protein